jgi:predicted phage-related endonuclease
MNLPNLPLPDQLAEVRLRLKELETREAELKQALLSDPDTRTGVSWIAEIKTVQTTRTDLKELRANHKDLVDEFTFQVPVTRVELLGLTEDGELISARKFRAAVQSGETQ